jgi:hypothetical protein
LRIQVVFQSLIACCLVSLAAFAQDQSQLPQAERSDQWPVALAAANDAAAAEPGSQKSSPVDPNSQGNGTRSKPSGGTATPVGSGTATPATPYVFPSKGDMNRYWLRNTLGPKPLLGAAFTAGWRTWDNNPHEWEGNIGGFGKRFGSTLLDSGINTTTMVFWSEAMHQDPMYFRCGCKGTMARAKHAIKLAFTARNRNGDLVFSLPRVISPFAGPMVTRNTIYPDRFGFGSGAAGGAYYLGGGVAWNLAKEFIFHWK